jgi:DNA-directed RNA polymerase specialized sigma24 family protein
MGNVEDTKALQDVFLKAFERTGLFQGRSKFSTWLTSIPVNTAGESRRLRQEFRPRELQGLAENPEQEVGTAFGLSGPALKARLVRGRLMLRESLAPHFVQTARRSHASC